MLHLLSQKPVEKKKAPNSTKQQKLTRSRSKTLKLVLSQMFDRVLESGWESTWVLLELTKILFLGQKNAQICHVLQWRQFIWEHYIIQRFPNWPDHDMPNHTTPLSIDVLPIVRNIYKRAMGSLGITTYHPNQLKIQYQTNTTSQVIKR